MLFTPFLLNLSGALTDHRHGSAGRGHGAATVLIADRMHRAGRRGLFETLTRRVDLPGRPSPEDSGRPVRAGRPAAAVGGAGAAGAADPG